MNPIAMPNVMKNGGWPWFIQLCRSGQDAISALNNAAFCPGECNFFVYAGNNPVNMVDLTGYWNWGKFGIGLAIFVVGIAFKVASIVTLKTADVFSSALAAMMMAGVTSLEGVYHSGESAVAYGIAIAFLVSPGLALTGVGGWLMWQGASE